MREPWTFRHRQAFDLAPQIVNSVSERREVQRMKVVFGFLSHQRRIQSVTARRLIRLSSLKISSHEREACSPIVQELAEGFRVAHWPEPPVTFNLFVRA